MFKAIYLCGSDVLVLGSDGKEEKLVGEARFKARVFEELRLLSCALIRGRS